MKPVSNGFGLKFRNRGNSPKQIIQIVLLCGNNAERMSSQHFVDLRSIKNSKGWFVISVVLSTSRHGVLGFLRL